MTARASRPRFFCLASSADAARRLALIVLATCAVAAPDGRAQSFTRQWSGAISDVFNATATFPVYEYAVEDGGRMRWHHPFGGPWIDFPTPIAVKDSLRRVHVVMDQNNTPNVWGVGLNGWVIRNRSFGTQWDLQMQMPAVLPALDGPNEDMQDVHFLTPTHGWIAGLRGIWYTTDGGQIWRVCSVRINGVALTPQDYASKKIKIRAMDIIPGAVPLGQDPFVPGFGLACAEPGYIFRTTEGTTWDRVFDIKDACLNGVIPANMASHICPEPYPPPANPANSEPWDIEMSRHPAQKLALFVGGYGTGTGLVFASGDDGTTWAPEHHECACAGPNCMDCTTNQAYNPTPGNPSAVYRHQYFRTLYGVSIFNKNNSAVAVGHDGQHLVRTPLLPAGAGVWQDRSSFNENYLTAPSTPPAVVYPLHGVMAEPRLDQPGDPVRCVVTGWGGHIRESTDGGHTWSDSEPGDPHPIQNIRFFDVSPFGAGWQMGQFFRTARTADEGVTWVEARPSPALTLPSLRAMDFASDNLNGVCVGDLDPATSYTKPRILWTSDNAGTGSWDIATVDTTGAESVGKLNDVTWTGAQSFWAAGDNGLIMKSVNGGALWRFVRTNDAQNPDLFFKGIGFRDGTTGILVGKWVGSSLPPNHPQGVAFQIKTGVDPNFTDISPADPDITFLSDVAVSLIVAFAVGEKVDHVTGAKTGIVLSSTFSNGNFQAFQPMTQQPIAPACQAGADLSGASMPGELASDVAVLNEIDLLGGRFWVAGECGRAWRRSSGGPWVEVKSNTDTHFTGLSVVDRGSPNVDNVYMGGYRFNQTGQCIVHYKNP